MPKPKQSKTKEKEDYLTDDFSDILSDEDFNVPMMSEEEKDAFDIADDD